MANIDFNDYKLVKYDGVFSFRNDNTTIGFIRFNEGGEVEYIFVNPLFRKKGIAKKLLKLTRDSIGKKLILQEPISPLGTKLINLVEKLN